MTGAKPPDRSNGRGGAWLLADFALNICALSIVKALGLGIPAVQIVFLRALVGFALILPLIWHQRAAFRTIPAPRIQAVRVVLSVIALSASFFAIPRVPLALFTAINFIRPLVTMLMVALLLRETIGRRRWLAAGVALLGVVIALDPAIGAPWPGLAAMAVVVLTGCGAIAATRALRDTPPIVMMAFYTAGLSIVTAPMAVVLWQPLDATGWTGMICVGVFAQIAQLCFLRAHFHGEAGFLSVLSYTSLIFSVGVGWLVFGEVPTARFFAGAALVIAAVIWGTLGRKGRASE